MELNTHICSQLVEKKHAFAQITLDDDYIVRDNKPDVLRIIYTYGNILPEDTKVGNGNLWVSGKLRFHSLYQSDDENHRLECIIGEIPFQEKLVMEGAEDGDNIEAYIQIEDLSVGMIHSRKLVVRAVLNITVKNLEEEFEQIACGVPSESEYEQKRKSMTMMSLLTNRKDVVRMQKELVLPNARTNVGSILFYQVEFRNEEVQLQEDKAVLQTDAQVVVIYRSELNGEYEFFETVVPLVGEMELKGIEGDEIFWATITPMEILLEPRTDYDGEARMLGLEVSQAVKMQVYREETCDVLLDAYSLKKELHLERRPFAMNQLLLKNVSKVRVMEQIHLEPNQERILQICGSGGTIMVDKAEKRTNGLWVEGILTVHILYHTTEDAIAYAHSSSQIPFEQFVEIAGFTEESTYWMDEKIEQLQVNLLDNAEYEVKASLQIAVLAMNCEEIANITAITEELPDIDRLQKQPGMIGCLRREGEDLWDIAKKYHATTDDIIEIGDKVLVIKQVQ